MTGYWNPLARFAPLMRDKEYEPSPEFSQYELCRDAFRRGAFVAMRAEWIDDELDRELLMALAKRVFSCESRKRIERRLVCPFDADKIGKPT